MPAISPPLYLHNPNGPSAYLLLHIPASVRQSLIPTSTLFKSHRVRRASSFLQVAVSKAPTHTKIVPAFSHLGASDTALRLPGTDRPTSAKPVSGTTSGWPTSRKYGHLCLASVVRCKLHHLFVREKALKAIELKRELAAKINDHLRDALHKLTTCTSILRVLTHPSDFNSERAKSHHFCSLFDSWGF